MYRLLYSIAIVIIVSQMLVAQNFQGGFNFNLPYDDSTTVDFLPQFPKKAIGENDFISSDNSGNFILNGNPVRFFGGNLTTQGAFPTKSDARKIAGRMRKMGINLIRFHHIDNPWSNGSLFYGVTGTRKLNTTLLDRLDYLIYQLKENGIYVNMNLNVSRTFKKSDGVYAADSLRDYAKGITLFNRRMIELEKEYAEQLLGHVNPYTGIPLAQDPVLAMVEFVNENSLFRRWYGNDLKPISQGGSLPLQYSLELDSLWLNYLLVKYDSTQNIAQAWNSGKKDEEIIFSDDFESGLDTDKWQLEKHNGAQATYNLHTDTNSGNSSVLVKAIKHGTESWHITFKNVGTSAKKDSIYELHFKAKSNAKHEMSAGFQRENSPWTYYMGASFIVDTMYQSYQVVFKAPENNTGNLRMWFRFSNNTGDFYIDDVIFKKAGVKGLEENESFENKNIRRLALHELNGFSKQRVSDLTEFYAQIQIDFLNEMKSWLRDTLQVQVPLAGTNWYVGPEDSYVQNTLDYLDNHAYWDHPSFPGTPWSPTDWTINNKPMMLGNSSTIERLFNGLTTKNKPYTVSEYNHGYPNQFQAEMLPMITSYLSFNGADGIMFFTYSGSWDWNEDRVNGYFDLHRNNSVMSGFPIFSYVYRNRLIKEAQKSIVVNYQKSDILLMPFDAQNGWGSHSPFPKELSYTNKIELTFDEEKPTDLSQIPAITGNPFTLNGDEVYWDKNGLFKINTAQFNCISGQLSQFSGAKTDQMILKSGPEFGSISWLSLVDSALNVSSKSVLYIGSKQINTGMVWDGTVTVHNKWGYNPSLIAPLSFTIKLKNNSAGLKVFPLDKRGNPDMSKVKYFVTDETGFATVIIKMDEDRTVW
ncbi:MAG: carbohydrate binding domain-containing protein, partial [Draconibacterium sp.]|nr:carbohydrate binding domain-containing protein [Draconibacterium sp.]